jgi:hypothetical protein
MSNHVIHVTIHVIHVTIHVVIHVQWSSNVSGEAFSINMGGGGQKCFPGLRQTVFLSAEAKIDLRLFGNIF